MGVRCAECARTSSISRPSSVSLPTNAMRSANLMLRQRSMMPRFPVPPHDPSNSNHNSTQKIRAGYDEQYRLRPLRNQKSHAGNHQNGKRRARLRDTDLFEARITPRADHQQRNDNSNDQP